jgi:hypothetical protein
MPMMVTNHTSVLVPLSLSYCFTLSFYLPINCRTRGKWDGFLLVSQTVPLVSLSLFSLVAVLKGRGRDAEEKRKGEDDEGCVKEEVDEKERKQRRVERERERRRKQ